MQVVQDRAAERAYFCRRCSDSDAGLDPADRSQVMAPCTSLRHVILQRRPHIRRLREHILESRRHHADDCVLYIVEPDDPPDCDSIREEVPPPQAVADDDDIRTAGRVVGGVEVPADDGSNTERAEVGRADLRSDRMVLS